MEHAFEFEEVRPWRTAAIVASAVAALELVALIVAGALIIARPLAHRTVVAVHRPPAAVTPKKKAAKPKPPAILPRARTRVAVLNGNGETGAASTEADALRARGYKISSVGNAPQPVTGPSLVMYRPGYAAEGKRLAHDTGLVAAAIDGLPTRLLGRSHVVILLGSS